MAQPGAGAGDEQPALLLRDLHFTYPGASRPALRGINLRVRQGELVVVMGASGAGKTTLARCINRAIPTFFPGALSGEVLLQGRRLEHERVAELAGVVGTVVQDFETQLFATSVQQEVAFGMEQLGVPREQMVRRMAEVLELVGLQGLELRDPSTLSGGQKQRLAIAAVLALHPSLLILDEPTTDLDPETRTRLFELLLQLRRAGKSILIIEHEVEAAAQADRVLVLEQGQVALEGTPAQVLRCVAQLEALGVRPADLDGLAHALRRPERFSSLEEAQSAVRPWLQPPAPDPRPPPREPLLEVVELSSRYPDGRQVLRDVTLRIGAGEFIALLGHNGSGKSTLAQHLNGLLRPAQGQVLLESRDLQELSLAEICRTVGYVFQNPDHQLSAATVEEEVLFGLRNLDLPEQEVAQRLQRALDTVRMLEVRHSDPFLLSKGQRQRLAVASLLALQSRLLVLDEPTTGLDYTEQRRMLALLRELNAQGMSILLITHSLWVAAENAQRALVMEQGRVVFDGSMRGVFEDEALLRLAHLRAPEVTTLGRRLGCTPLSVQELLSWMKADAPREVAG